MERLTAAPLAASCDVAPQSQSRRDLCHPLQCCIREAQAPPNKAHKKERIRGFNRPTTCSPQTSLPLLLCLSIFRSSLNFSRSLCSMLRNKNITQHKRRLETRERAREKCPTKALTFSDKPINNISAKIQPCNNERASQLRFQTGPSPLRAGCVNPAGRDLAQITTCWPRKGHQVTG